MVTSLHQHFCQFLVCLSAITSLAWAADAPSHTYYQNASASKVHLTVQSKPLYKTWIIPNTPHPVTMKKISSSGILFYQCIAHPNASEQDDPLFGLRSICFIDLHEQTPTERIFSVPMQVNEQLMLADTDGDWVLYTSDGNVVWNLRNVRTGEHIPVGSLSVKKVQHPTGPFASMSQGNVAFVDEYLDGTSLRNRVQLFDITHRTLRTLFDLPPTQEIDRLSLDGHHLAYSLVDISEKDTHHQVTSDIYLYDLSTKKHLRLSTTGAASEPMLSWPYLVWKTNTLFGTGGVFLYHVKTKEGAEVAKPQSLEPPFISYEFPGISEQGALWAPMGSGSVTLFDPTGKKKPLVLDPNGYKTHVKGRYASWTSETLCPTGEKKCIVVVQFQTPKKH